MKLATKSKLARVAMLVATLIWGSSFFIMKNTVEEIPAFYLLGMRFIPAALILAVVFMKRMRQINKSYLFRGFLLGALLLCAYSFQTFGLQQTTPGKNAFLTAVYCVIVPFLYWAHAKTRPDKYNIAASLLCVVGIGFVSLNAGLSINMGDALTLIGGFFYAAHIVAFSDFSQKHDVFVLTVVQFVSAGVLSLLLAFFFQPMPDSIPPATVLPLLYLIVMCTAIALLLQGIGQKYTHPSTAAIILSLESVFGVIFSILFYHEHLNLQIGTGFVLIFASILISETKLSFLKPAAVLQSAQNTDA